jgi:uncharacterized Fe-S cluster protein YjdI
MRLGRTLPRLGLAPLWHWKSGLNNYVCELCSRSLEYDPETCHSLREAEGKSSIALEVTWVNNTCIQSGNRVKTLPQVFKVEGGKFVIDPAAADGRACKRCCATWYNKSVRSTRGSSPRCPYALCRPSVLRLRIEPSAPLEVTATREVNVWSQALLRTHHQNPQLRF